MASPLRKFELGDDRARDFYRENGFCVVSAVIPEAAIGAFLEIYSVIKRSRYFIYYAQSIHRWISPELTPAGFIKESMWNPSCLGFYPRFRTSLSDILFHPNASRCLRLITGHPYLIEWQDMFFDRSTGTIEHQDAWYVDTEPPGHLIGTWYALEDISERSGPFFVYAKTHTLKPMKKPEIPDQDRLRERVLTLVSGSRFEKVPALLSRGDVLFFHPTTIHGADDPSDEKASRKSLTAHFYPLEYPRQGASSQRAHKKDLAELIPTANPHIYKLGFFGRRPMVFGSIGLAKHLKGLVLRDFRPRRDMRRRAYRA